MSIETRIKLTGYSDAYVVEAIFASSLVDVAYIDEVTPSCIFVVADSSVDLNDSADYAWVKSVIESELMEPAIRIELDQQSAE